MNKIRSRSRIIIVVLFAAGLVAARCLAQAPSPEEALKQKKDERRRFQDQELITAKPMSYIFNPGDSPRIVWRDVDEVRRLGSDGALRVRWFDTDLKEEAKPSHPGRWSAYIEGHAPNGTPVRRSLTFYCRPPLFLLFFFPPEFDVSLPQKTSTIKPDIWREHQEEIASLPKNLLFRALNDTQESVILLAGLAEAKPLGRPARTTESAAVLDADFQLAVKLKAQGLQDKVRALTPPRKRATPAPVLREGPPAEAGLRPETTAKLREVCKAWAEDSGEPFVTLVARHGVIVLHEAFGKDTNRQSLGLDARFNVFSITKSATGILFSQFLDQGLLDLDDSVATAFPDYPRDRVHVPSFRECFLHMGGLTGHADWGGMRNPHFENIVLNGIDANIAGKTYEYSGDGYELVAKAMEIVTGKSAVHLYHDHLFGPLGMGDVPIGAASSDAQFTARELATLGQWVVNRGSYGELEFIAPSTFEKLLPEPYAKRYPGVPDEGGIGIHWHRPVKASAPANSTRPQDLFFSPNMVGHGSLSSCIFLADLDLGLVIAQVRKTAGPRYAEWSLKYFQAIADGIVPEGEK